ncbi:flavodoxin family protein [Halanaerobaculum tunisiense]
MKGLSILGSPNQKGNNAQLLQTAVTEIKKIKPEMDFEYISANKLDISPCQACGSCEEQLGCIIKDDMTQLYTKFNQADLILFASPLYFNSVSAQLKTLIDRCQALWASKVVLNDPLVKADKKRVAGFISTAGQPLTEDRFKYVTGTIDLLFKSLNVDYSDTFFVGNIDQQPIKDRPYKLNKIKNWSQKLVSKL